MKKIFSLLAKKILHLIYCFFQRFGKFFSFFFLKIKPAWFLFVFFLFCIFSSSPSFAVFQEAECQAVWSEGFDRVEKYMIEDSDRSVMKFLNMNDIPGSDMWSGFRPISLEHRCHLDHVCHLVWQAEDSSKVDYSYSSKNALGGSIPSDMAGCVFENISPDSPLGALVSELKALDYSSCALAKNDDRRKILSLNTCDMHADLKAEVFDRSLEAMMWKDMGRKTIGYFMRKLVDPEKGFYFRMKKIREEFDNFFGCVNGIFGKLCPIGQVE